MTVVTASGSGHKLLTFTIDPRTARMVKLEGLDAAGARHELSGEELESLTRRTREKTIERVIERAFEAGIACVLDGASEPDDPNETVEDVELTHQLLSALIERSAAKELLARDVLDRAILDTLIEQAIGTGPAAQTEPAPLQ